MFRKNTATNAFDQMDSTLHAGMFDPEVNPQTTGSNGRYAWDVAPGDYFVRAGKPGCSTEDSIVVTIPPEVTDLDIELTCPDTDGDGLKDHEEIEIGSSIIDGDTDSDGCRDSAEKGSDEAIGGRRDFLNFWDFYDTPNQFNARDRMIDLFNDIFAVALRFGASGDPGGDPLAGPIPASPGYHTAFDRSSPPPGGDPWDAQAADGIIDLFNDIFGVAFSSVTTAGHRYRRRRSRHRRRRRPSSFQFFQAGRRGFESSPPLQTSEHRFPHTNLTCSRRAVY